MSRFCSTRWHGLAVIVAGAVAAASPSPTPSRHHRVDMRAVRFQPGALDVAPGDRVAWTNHDAVPHTVTAADASWDSGEVAPGETFTWVVKGTGTIPYVCRYHATMKGRLTVPS